MSNPIFDYRPQLPYIKRGKEPSLRQLIQSFYACNGFSINEAENLTEQYLDDYFDEIFSAIGSN